MRAPRVSVVMAVRDGGPYLAEAVESLLAQGFADFELVVVDDGSSDASRDVVRSYGDPRIRLLENGRNLGLAPSLNRGIREARGELLARQDADDVSEPGRLERQVQFLDRRPDVALVGTWFTEVAADGGSPEPRALPCEHLPIAWSMLFFCPFVHSAVMWRREPVAAGVGFYDESLRYSMDFDLWRRIARRMGVANLPEHLVRLRVHGSSMTATLGDATREGERMQAAEVGRLLGWDPREAARNGERFRSLGRLLRWTEGGPTPADAAGTDDVLRLHEAFCREAGIPHAAAERHRAELRAHLGRTLLLLAAASGRAAGRELAVRAARLHPRGLLRRGALRTWGGLLGLPVGGGRGR